jgi:WD40 repeat protein/Flp pilus assembly protein TadD
MSSRAHASASFKDLPSEVWQRLDGLLDRFEAAWRRGEHSAFDEYLAQAGSERRILLVELVHAELELRLKAGEPAGVEEYLDRYPELRTDQAAVMDRVATEFRPREGDGASQEEYQARFPENAEALKDELASAAATEAVTLAPAGPAVDPVVLPPTAPPAVEPGVAQGSVAVPGYEILGELGQGGFGVVYKARQLGLDRTVALKMILHAEHAGGDTRQRFRIEAEAVARLQHPHIVQIHEVGEAQGLPYFSLEFCAGGSLADRLRGTPLPPREAAALLETLARAVQAAHERHIVHRDLKPGNVLFAANGQPKITDFGLAKKLDEQGTTQTGAVMGTPPYMAPEQVGGKSQEIGPAADVYALGAVLYQCLTGRPPFSAATAVDTMLQVLTEEPVPPTKLQPQVPRDLETITLKCLRKEPSRRYVSAAALAEDLRRFLGGEPIQARPVGVLERSAKWVRRRPAVAGLLLALVGVLTGSFLGLTGLWLRAEKQWVRAESAGKEAERRLVDLQITNGVRLTDEGDLFAALPWLVEALAKEQGNPEKERVHRLRLGTVLQQCPRLVQRWTVEGRVRHAVFSPGGRQVFIASDQQARVSDLVTSQSPFPPLQYPAKVWHAVFSPDGRRLVTLDGSTGRVWDLPSRQPLGSPLQHKSRVVDAAFSPDGSRLVTASFDRTARVWNATTGQPVSRPLEHPGEVRNAAFSPDGRRVLSVSWPAGHLWDVATGQLLAPTFPLKGSSGLVDAAFSPNGQRIVTCEQMTISLGGARVWDAATGRPVSPLLKHAATLTCAAFSPDNRLVVTSSWDGTARVWDPATGEPVTPPLKHNGMVHHASFSPDGRHVVTASVDTTARVWDAATGEPATPPLRHHSAVDVAAFSPDGQLLITAGGSEVRVWDVSCSGPGLGRALRHKEEVLYAAFSADDRHVVTGSRDGTARVWDAATCLPVCLPLKNDTFVGYAAFSADGQRVVTVGGVELQEFGRYGGSGDGSARVWDARSGRALTPSLKHKGGVWFAAFSPDARRIVTAAEDGNARVWEVDMSPPPPLLLQHDGPVRRALFSPDGSAILTAVGNFEKGDARVWDAAGGKLLFPPLKHQQLVTHAAFSPDGRQIVTASQDEKAQLWSAGTGEKVGPPLKHSGGVGHAAFSADGRRIATASWDQTARIWDAARATQLAPPLQHRGEVRHAAFSRDGRFVVTASQDGTARVWDAATGQPVTPPLRHGKSVLHAEFSSDGRRIVTASKNNPARIWELQTEDRPVEDLLRLCRVLTGNPDEAAGAGEPERQSLEAAWQELRAKYPRAFSCTPEEVLAWHRHEAGEAEAGKQWFAAVWHLDRLIEAEPGGGNHYLHRCRARAACGRWDQAAADFARAVAFRADDADAWEAAAKAFAGHNQWDKAAACYEKCIALGGGDMPVLACHGLVCAGAGDQEGCRKGCAELVRRFGQTDNAETANNVAWYCARLPDAGVDRAQLVALAEKAVASQPKSYARLNTLGTALYRAGRFEASIRKLQEGIEVSDKEGTAWDWLVLAMAHQRLGHTKEARQWLARAVQWLDQNASAKPEGTDARPTLSWEQRLELRLLREEAEPLVNRKGPQGP